MKTKMQKLDQEITSIKKQMFEIGDMRPGSLTQQMRKAKENYGSYCQLSYTYRGKGRTGYIREGFVKQVAAETANYKLYKELLDQLILLSIEKSELRMELSKKALATEN